MLRVGPGDTDHAFPARGVVFLKDSHARDPELGLTLGLRTCFDVKSKRQSSSHVAEFFTVQERLGLLKPSFQSLLEAPFTNPVGEDGANVED